MKNVEVKMTYFSKIVRHVHSYYVATRPLIPSAKEFPYRENLSID